MSVGTTTIKVSKATRDRLNEVAAAEGCTAGSMVEKLLSEHLWRAKVELAKKQMREATSEEWADYMEEFRIWDSTLMDGLEEEPWEE